VNGLRWTVVVLAMIAPAAALAPGCGARSDLDWDDEPPTYPYEDDVDASDAGDASDGSDAPDALPDAPEEAGHDAEPDVVEDGAADAEPDVVEDGAADAEPDVVEDGAADAEPDVVEDGAADAEPDVVEDGAADAEPDVVEDGAADAEPDVVEDGGCKDADGDGYSTCDGDCDDGDPNINPGAFDFPNGRDDDCDGGIDNAVLDCGSGLLYTSQSATDYAKALDICQTTTLNATGAQKRWGLISAEFRLADGTGVPGSEQHAIVTSLGVVGPRKNANFVYLSTGQAAAPGQPYFRPAETPQSGTAVGTQSSAPPGFPLNKASCPQPTPGAFDPVNLKLRLRTPTNALSFAFDHGFYSAEYPEYACTVFNDSWVALLDTAASGIANNRNIIFDAQGTPGSVNLNFFDRCVAGPTGCYGGTAGFNFCSGGKGGLQGTGFGLDDLSAPCGPSTSIGGGTGWLTTQSEMVPGEIITLQLMVWDSSDMVYDSGVTLDYFRWLTDSLASPKTFR
jgi:hypothetical protein